MTQHCEHRDVTTYSTSDGSMRMWACVDCRRRFYPACSICVSIAHRDDHESDALAALAKPTVNDDQVGHAPLDVDRLADAFHDVDHPALYDCRLSQYSTAPGKRYCRWKAEIIAAEYARDER